ncbi:MAG TPA: hypothetical protein VER98_05090 [Terriglobia bacterium]|nr:hypothetical protein [Terriglobia bacterium]
MANSRSILAFIVLLLTSVSVSAQWLHYPTPGIPRTPDGKPNLTAPAPKTRDGKPDLSGIWKAADTKYFQDLGAGGVEIPMLPWAKALYEERKRNLQKGHPSERCLGHGVADFDTHQTPRRIVQSPGVIAILFESYHQYRQILVDGRPLPEPSQPAFFGYSVGRWEGDTLVVETNGLNDKGWLDMNGHPQTETTRITERYRRRNFGHIDLELTIDDPKTYTRPWTVALSGLNLLPDEDLIEAVCENERDASHMVGK